VFLAELGNAPISPPSPWPPHRPSASPACWPAPGGHGLVNGAGGGRRQVDAAADSGRLPLSPQRWPVSLLRLDCPSGRPGLISGFSPGVVGSSARRAFRQDKRSASRGWRPLKRQLGSADHPVLDSDPTRILRLALHTFTLRATEGQFHSDHCIAGNGGGAAAPRKLRAPDTETQAPAGAAARAHQPRVPPTAGRCRLEQVNAQGAQGSPPPPPLDCAWRSPRGNRGSHQSAINTHSGISNWGKRRRSSSRSPTQATPGSGRLQRAYTSKQRMNQFQR